uniref:Death domain-containing protein n=1 Tax=Amphimedon queenslandica TaxID=400682 RepID=A0A1X7SKT6_AMPQE
MASSSSSAPFINVCDKELNINEHYYDVYEKMKSLSPRWKQIAISWRIRIDTINKIESNHRGDIETCLQKAIEYWLMKDYDYKRYGGPCWRMVCVAVKEGGRNSALADEIAREHPLPATTGGATPHPLPATTGGATPHPLPATTGGATPHPLPANTGGATPHLLPATTGRATPHPLPATTGGATPHFMGGPINVTIHDKGMSPSASSTGWECTDSVPGIIEERFHLPSNNAPKMSLSDEQAMSPGKSSDTCNPGKKTWYVTYPPSQPPNQGQNLEITIKLQKMNEEFADLFYQTRKALEELHLSDIIEYIEAHVISVLSPNDQTLKNKELFSFKKTNL